MSIITWNDSLSVEITEIDDQHKQLIVILNELHEAMKNRVGQQIVGKKLEEMAKYSKVHFDTEEKYFSLFDYDNSVDHIAEHEKFVVKTDEFKKDLSEGKLALSIDVMNFLMKWITDHIMVSDHKYIKCFKEHGLGK